MNRVSGDEGEEPGVGVAREALRKAIFVTITV